MAGLRAGAQTHARTSVCCSMQTSAHSMPGRVYKVKKATGNTHTQTQERPSTDARRVNACLHAGYPDHGPLPGHTHPVPQRGRGSSQCRAGLPERNHTDHQRHAQPCLSRLPGRGVCARSCPWPTHRQPWNSLRASGWADPREPRGGDAGALRCRHEPLAGAGDGLPDASPGRDPAPGSPLGPGEPTLRQAECRLLGTAAAVRAAPVR